MMTVEGALAAIRSPAGWPSSLTGLLFERQGLYWLLAFGVAGVAVYVGNSRRDARLQRIGLALAAVGVLWIVAAGLVDTPAERLYRAHTGLAAAAQQGDVDWMLSYLAPDFQSSVIGVATPHVAREEIGARLKAYGVKGSTITYYKSDILQKNAFTTLTLITQTDMGPVRTTWGLSWDDLPGEDWKIRSADLQKLGDETVSPDRVLPKEGERP